MQDKNQNLTDRQLYEAIYLSCQKTERYMKWQLIITIALIVIPLLGALALVPMALSGLSALTGAYLPQ